MDIQTLTGFFMWCTIMNGALLVLWCLGVNVRHATVFDQPLQPACHHSQGQGEPLEPLPRLEAAQSYGSRGPGGWG